MGCGGSKSDPEQQAQKNADRAIQKSLQADANAESKDIKLLLLGAGESGKSTIFKQMKIIHSNGYGAEECSKFRDIIYTNLLSGIKTLCVNADKLEIQLSNEENQEYAEKIMALADQQIYTSAASLLTPDMWVAIRTLSKDKGILETWGRRAEFQINDSALFYIAASDRLSDAGYSPSQEDVLKARVKTLGIVESEFVVEKMKFKMVDVGGQRNERRKWIHVFDDVTSIIFVVGLSEYDQKLFEDTNVNRMKEALQLFDETANCRDFKNTSVVVFFNKKDLFSEKIKTVDLRVCFDDYNGGCNYDEAIKFIKHKFQTLNKSNTRQIHSHITCATDTNNIKVVFDAVKNIVLFNNMRNANFV